MAIDIDNRPTSPNNKLRGVNSLTSHDTNQANTVWRLAQQGLRSLNTVYSWCALGKFYLGIFHISFVIFVSFGRTTIFSTRYQRCAERTKKDPQDWTWLASSTLMHLIQRWLSTPILQCCVRPKPRVHFTQASLHKWLICVGVYVIIKERVIECPSISNMEDTLVTRTLRREGSVYY